MLLSLPPPVPLSPCPLWPPPSPQARELATVCCTCSELQHLGSSNELWEALYTRDFPSATAPQRSQAALRGWAWGYRQQHAVQLEAAAARRRASQRPQHAPFFPGPLPGLPMVPARRVFPPGVIGGDYDRLPGLPGGLGGGGFMGAGQGLGRGGFGGPGPLAWPHGQGRGRGGSWGPPF